MRPQCLMSARFNLTADILKQSMDAPPNDPTQYGRWVEQQDPLTGDIIRIWVPFVPDNPNTPQDETVYESLPCIAKGIVEGGARNWGSEEWSEMYRNTELVNMYFPSSHTLTKRDRVLNIRNQKGQVLWKEEETGKDGVYKATVFEVLGVTPITDMFGNHIENFALLSRAEVQ
jgi:hypothetical protein